jgi:hypothetical protein
MIKFRGTKVLQGATSGCAFFEEALVDSELDEENAKDWQYEIFFHPSDENHGYDIYTASATWVCVDGRTKRRTSYCVLAEAGEYLSTQPAPAPLLPGRLIF